MLAHFMSTGHKLQLTENRELQLLKYLHKMAHRQVCKVLVLINDRCHPWPSGPEFIRK